MPTIFKPYTELDNMLEIGDIGLVNVCPFKDMENGRWQGEEWTMRLLNAGDVLDVQQRVRSLAGRMTDDETQMQKIEMFCRSVVTRNGRPLVTEEALSKYNDDHKTNLTALELALISARNLEQFVLNRWDIEYGRLMAKQINYIKGIVVCKNCNSLLPISTQGLPPIENFDEVDYCIYCPDKEEAIRKSQLSKSESDDDLTTIEPIVGKSLLDGKDIDLGG